MELATALRYLTYFLLLAAGPSCIAQEAKIRVINGANGRPLPKFAASVAFLYDKNYDKEIPANHSTSLKLETDGNGEAFFKIPQPPPMHFAAQVRWIGHIGIVVAQYWLPRMTLSRKEPWGLWP